MKILFTLLMSLLGLTTIKAQTENVHYKKELADSLEADDYGMKTYILVILKTGDNKHLDKRIQDSLFVGHLQNIGRLANAGKLIIAGPLQKNKKSYEGIFVLNVKTFDEAKILLDTDPAIKSKILDTELFQWYGSAALPLYLKYHDNVKKKNF